MGGTLAGSGIRRAVAHRRRFPALVAGGSLVLALVLFFQGTVPALRERQQLLRLEEQRLLLHKQFTREATGFALRRTALSRDIQTLLLELDRQGIYPRDLVEELRQRTAERQGSR